MYGCINIYKYMYTYPYRIGSKTSNVQYIQHQVSAGEPYSTRMVGTHQNHSKPIKLYSWEVVDALVSSDLFLLTWCDR